MESKKEKKKIREKEVPEKKIKAVQEIADLIKNKKTTMIVSIKNLPAKQFQLIKKKIRDKADVRIVKKNIMNRAIDSIEKGVVKNLKNHIKEDIALVFSDIDIFELSGILSENKTRTGAKPGQIAPEDIEVEEGPTELVPGPAISELGALGIQIAVEDGKINIKQKKTIVKKGEKIKENAAAVMMKLDIKPFMVGLEPDVAYDSEEDKIYEDIKIDKEATLEELKTSYNKALGFAIKIVYICKDTIGFLLAKANSEVAALEPKNNIQTKSEKQEEKPEEKAEEKQEEENKSEEIK